MQRRTRITAIVFGTFVFLGISFLLARALTGAGAERARVLDILRGQARGDAEAVLREMPACRRDDRCARLTTERTGRLKRPGEVEIVRFDASVQAALTDRTGRARVVWRTSQRRFPVVQCVVVRRDGPLTGGGVEIVSISNPVGLEAPCGA